MKGVDVVISWRWRHTSPMTSTLKSHVRTPSLYCGRGVGSSPVLVHTLTCRMPDPSPGMLSVCFLSFRLKTGHQTTDRPVTFIQTRGTGAVVDHHLLWWSMPIPLLVLICGCPRMNLMGMSSLRCFVQRIMVSFQLTTTLVQPFTSLHACF